MAWVGIAMAVVSVVQGLQQAKGARNAADAQEALGVQERQAAEARAAQYRSNAVQQVAASQRTAINDEHAGNLAASKMIAAAGASGGGGPQVRRLVSDVMTRGSYNAHMDLYNGEENARQMNAMADNASYQGVLNQVGANNRAQALNTQATGSLIGAAGKGLSMFGNYGGGGPGAGAMSFGQTATVDPYNP